ncbi:Mu transposase C-terminal domain-containing protein [Streptomyces sp. CA-132043]|uniref:Mu transposase C-terminal domain-containing protein n=1 Tax=Streptomyces sp. CA-132043 TaxID=3240048 RepID=UPI003D907D91
MACDPRMAGAAARPVIRPKMVVVDHGKIFNSEHFTDVCTTLNISVRSARERTPTDKAIVESLFSAIKNLFCQYVAGYTGSDLARRGKHLHDGPLWSINELQDLLDAWIALHWQQRPHDGLRNPFLPGMTVSPNRMYAALVAAEGYVPLVLGVHENRKLLPFKRCKVTRKGVRIGNRTYNSPELQQYYKRHSGVRGQGMKWQVRYNPYAPRFVWLYDHTEDTWAEAEFIHQRLIGDSWTQYLWEQVTAAHVELGGERDDERAIARAVAGLRERARRGPQSPAQTPALFTGPKLALRAPKADRYAAIRPPVPGMVQRAPSLNVPAGDLFAGPRPALPSPTPSTENAGPTKPAAAVSPHRPGRPPAPSGQPDRPRRGSLRPGRPRPRATTGRRGRPLAQHRRPRGDLMSRSDLIHSGTDPLAEARTGPLTAELLTTKEGWNDFVRRVVTPPDLQDCAPLGTKVNDNDPRMSYHGEMLPVATPALRRGLKDARRILRPNRFSSVGRGADMVIDGERGAGKTLLLCQIGRGYQGLIERDQGADNNSIPVVYINVPPDRDSNMHWSLPFADFLGLQYMRNPGKGDFRTLDMTLPITYVMKNAGTQLILVDGIDRLSDSEARTALSYFESLQDHIRATFVYCGTGAREVLHAARYSGRRSQLPQQGEKFDSDLPVLWAHAIDYSPEAPDAWEDIVEAFEDDLRLYKHKKNTLLELSSYLHQRTGGYIETLHHLICQAAQEAIDNESEAITRELLDDIRVGRGDLDGQNA